MKRKERISKSRRRFYLNVPEDMAASCLADSGVEFTKRGYPDITVYNSDGSIYGFIEVKPHKEHPLKKTQELFQSFCVKHDVPFIRWSPDEGPEKIKIFLERRTTS